MLLTVWLVYRNRLDTTVYSRVPGPIQEARQTLVSSASFLLTMLSVPGTGSILRSVAVTVFGTKKYCWSWARATMHNKKLINKFNCSCSTDE